jgi:hypothetical protein
MFNIASLFTVESLIRRLKQLPILKTPVMDSVFGYRPQQGLPVVGADLVQDVARELPLVRRGAPSVPMATNNGSVAFYEPLPVRPSAMVTGVDLNNLKVMGHEGREAWALGRTEMLRRACHKTTEAMCAVSLSGTLSWPVQIEGGVFDTWTIEFGSPLSVTPTKLFSAADAKLKDIFSVLQAMEEKLEEKGYGSVKEIWAGKTAYEAIFAIAEASTSTAKIRVELSERGADIGGYLVKRRAETYRSPSTGTATACLDLKTLRMIATDAGHTLPYCALDDLDANLQPLPFFVKPIELKDPSGYKLVAESKPLPIPNMDGVCDAVVVA